MTANLKCLICGKDMREPLPVDFEGERYYVCCQICKLAFEKEPHKYASMAKTEGELTQ